MKSETYQNSIVDYINGHLSNEQAKAFEDELSQNEDLQQALNEAKQWQTQLQDQPLDSPTPQFSSIESKLTTKQWGFKPWGYGLSTAASIALAAIIFVQPSSITNNEFETLTNSQAIYNEPVLQIVLSNETNIEDFVADYNLNLMQVYPNTHIIDVQFNDSLKELLKTDERIVLTKMLGVK